MCAPSSVVAHSYAWQLNGGAGMFEMPPEVSRRWTAPRILLHAILILAGFVLAMVVVSFLSSNSGCDRFNVVF